MEPSRLPPQIAERLSAAELTYPDVGATDAVLPAGYHHVRMQQRIGAGRDLFASAADAIRMWRVHAGAGLTVAASSPVATPDAVVVLGLGVGRLSLRAPCRVVYALDEPRRRGFAYGTLPGHLESGEESFVVELAEDGTICFSITAFSRPASAISRLAGPAGVYVQHAITRRYLRALQAAARQDKGSSGAKVE